MKVQILNRYDKGIVSPLYICFRIVGIPPIPKIPPIPAIPAIPPIPSIPEIPRIKAIPTNTWSKLSGMQFFD